MRTILITSLCLILATTQSLAKVAFIQFSELIECSELIVVAKVQQVKSLSTGRHYAEAKISEIWKGKSAETIEFLASPTWPCDISDAKAGETVLLFLTKNSDSRSYAISHSGRGRRPVHVIDGKRVVFFGEVIIPAETPTVKDEKAKGRGVKWFDVETVQDMVATAQLKASKRSP